VTDTLLGGNEVVQVVPTQAQQAADVSANIITMSEQPTQFFENQSPPEEIIMG
jgi:hypothetical protein